MAELNLSQGSTQINGGDLFFTNTLSAPNITGLCPFPLTSVQIAALTPQNGSGIVLNTDTGFYEAWDPLTNTFYSLSTSTSLAFATVGVGGQYPTISAAFAANQFNLYIVSNITETADYTFTADQSVSLFIPNAYTVDCNTFNPFIFGTINLQLQTFGAGSILYDSTGVDRNLFDFNSCNSVVLNLSPGLTLIDNSTGSLMSYMLYWPGLVDFQSNIDGCRFVCANKPQSGILGGNGRIRNFECFGGGTSCDNAVSFVGIGAIESGVFINQFNPSVVNISTGSGYISNTINASASTINVQTSPGVVIDGDNTAVFAYPAFNYTSTDSNISQVGTNPSGILANHVISTSISAVINNGYMIDNPSPVAVSLPSNIPFGSIIKLSQTGSGIFTVTLGAGQSIQFGNQLITGTLSSAQLGDSVTLECSTQDTVLTVTACVGGNFNFT